jgi:hypothetical protein
MTYVDYDSPPTFAPLLDTILVFARARTSALHSIGCLKVCRELASRLNSILLSVGAPYHQLELVRRGPTQFFITTMNSPRFSWNTRLTHRIIDQNLDYFAPGHITVSPHPPRGSILFIEKNSIKAVMAELVILSVLDDPQIRAGMHSFNEAKEELFNFSMSMLGLSYRFKWIFNTQATREAVAEVMMKSAPPSSEWWELNCYYVNGFGYPELVSEPGPFCSFASHYEQSWPMIQAVFNFMLKDKHSNLWFAGSTTGLPYWTAMGDLFGRIKVATEMISDPQELPPLVAEFTRQLNTLAKQANSSEPSTVSVEISQSAPSWNPIRELYNCQQRCAIAFHSFWESIKLHVFERYKLREPLVRKGVAAQNTIADHVLYQ